MGFGDKERRTLLWKRGKMSVVELRAATKQISESWLVGFWSPYLHTQAHIENHRLCHVERWRCVSFRGLLIRLKVISDKTPLRTGHSPNYSFFFPLLKKQKHSGQRQSVSINDSINASWGNKIECIEQFCLFSSKAESWREDIRYCVCAVFNWTTKACNMRSGKP